MIKLGGRRFFSGTTRIHLSFHEIQRFTINDIREKFSKSQPISMVTAHDFITGKFCQDANIDINLVGDSLAMVALGYEDTNEITFDEFLFHVKSVSRGNLKSLLIADLPFGSYEISPQQALTSSIRLIKEGRAQGIKLEGGEEIVPTIKLIVKAGIPVMGHVGLTPQRHNSLSGFKLQGNTVESALRIYNDCMALQKAGVFSIVLECIPNKLAEIITSKLSVPTIGIGAGPYCSGQVLVMADLLGMNGPVDAKKSKFVKQYSNFYELAVKGLESYKHEVSNRSYPESDAHGYKIKKDVLQEFRKMIE